MTTVDYTATAADAGHQAYPMPAPENDPRFTFGLIYQVGKVLAEHGFPPIQTGTDHVRLQQALFGFLYTLTPAALADAETSPQLATPACPGTPASPPEVATSPHLFVTTGRHA